jgi:hypothetical protein
MSIKHLKWCLRSSQMAVADAVGVSICARCILCWFDR